MFSVIPRSKRETRSFTPSKGNSFNSSSISPLFDMPSSWAMASSNSYSNLDSSAFFWSCKSFARCYCSARRHSISVANDCSAIFSSRANFSACDFFLKTERVLEVVDWRKQSWCFVFCSFRGIHPSAT